MSDKIEITRKSSNQRTEKGSQFEFYCDYCGAKFCPECGTKVEAA